MTKLNFLKNLGLEKFNSGVSTGAEWLSGNGTLTESVSPTDSSVIANVQNANREDYETLISKAQQAFPEWRKVPAPQRGDIVRQKTIWGNWFPGKWGKFIRKVWERYRK